MTGEPGVSGGVSGMSGGVSRASGGVVMVSGRVSRHSGGESGLCSPDTATMSRSAKESVSPEPGSPPSGVVGGRGGTWETRSGGFVESE